MSTRKRIKDPLVGFGWAGYVCAAILLALIAALVAGVELRYELLKLILHTLGVDAMMYFALHIGFFGFAMFGASVSVITGVGVLVALRVAPFRIHWFMQTMTFLLCTGWFLVPTTSVRVLGRSSIGTRIFGVRFSTFYQIELFGVVLIGYLVFRICRSGYVAAMWTLAVAIASINIIWFENLGTALPGSILLFNPFDQFEYTSVSLVFDLLTIGSLVLWAIHERRKIVPDVMCDACGYDIAGLPRDAACPECGQLAPSVIPSGEVETRVQ